MPVYESDSQTDPLDTIFNAVDEQRAKAYAVQERIEQLIEFIQSSYGDTVFCEQKDVSNSMFSYRIDGLLLYLGYDFVLNIRADKYNNTSDKELVFAKATIRNFVMNDQNSQFILRERNGNAASHGATLSITPFYNAAAPIAIDFKAQSLLKGIDLICVPLDQAQTYLDKAVAHYLRLKCPPKQLHPKGALDG